MGFSDDVRTATEKYRKRLAYTAKTATLDVCNEARLSGPSVANPDGGKGGRMPIDTGNLRNSMVAAIGSIPSGPTTGNENKQGDEVASQLVRWNPGTSLFYAGFTPKYARAMEYRYGFFRGAVLNWHLYVKKAADEAIKKIP